MSERKIINLQQLQQAQQLRSMSRQSTYKEGGLKVQHNQAINNSIFKQSEVNHQEYEREPSIIKSLQPQQDHLATRSHNNSKRYSLKQIKGITEDGLEQHDIWQKVNEILKRIKLKKYVKAFLSLSRIRLYKQLTPNQLQKINDSSFWKQNLQNDYKKKEFEEHKKQDKHPHKRSIWRRIKSIKIPIFLPHHFLFDMWQLLKICSTMICFYCYLVCFSFNKGLDELFPNVLLAICQTCIVLDIFITMNTGIYIRGILCTDRKELFNYYKSSKTFYYDISSSFFTTLFYFLYYNESSATRSTKILLLTIVFKLNDFYVVIKKIKQKFLLDRRAQNMIELLNLLKNILIISHIFACIWVLVGLATQQYYSEAKTSTKETPHSWIALMNLEDEQWHIQYLNSYYYIAVTMSTVGYGDIRPTNPIEIIVAVFIVMTCSVIFGFTLNSIGEIVQDFFQFEKQIQEKRYVIANYMDKNYINQITRKNIFEYLEYYWREQANENSEVENNIVSQLTDNLKEELLTQSNRLILKENKVLKEYFSPDLLAKCNPIIKEQRFTPNEVIINEQEGNTDCSIYFVLFGEVEVIYGSKKSNAKGKKLNSKIASFKRGDSFGEISFFTGQKGSLNIISKNFSKILKIKREEFINLLKGDSEQYEIFCKLNDRLIYSSDISLLYLKCSSCNSDSHDVTTCPSLHFIPRKFKIFGSNQITQPQKRNDRFLRKRNYKFGSLQSLEVFNEVCCNFIEQNIDDVLCYEMEFLEFNHFLKPQQNFQSDEENEPEKQKSQMDLTKLRNITNSELLESPVLPKKRLSYVKRIGGAFQKTSLEQIGGSLTNSNEDLIKDNPISRIQEFMVGLQKKMSNNENEFLQQENILRRDFIEEDKRSDHGYKALEKYVANARQNFTKRQTSRDFRDIQNNHVQFDVNPKVQKELLSKQTKLQVIESNEASQQIKTCRDDTLDFDLFLGHFERMTTFTHYFPKFNYENVINSLNNMPSSSKSQKLTLKDNIPSQMNRKIKDRKFQSILNQRDSQTRIKLKPEMQQSHETGKSPLAPSQLKQFNEYVSVDTKNSHRKASFLCNTSLNHISNLDNTVNIQINVDEPDTPPRNEKHIIDSGLPSIANFKNSFYNFASEVPNENN